MKKMKIKLFLLFIIGSLSLGLYGNALFQLPKSISEAQWLWCGPENNPPKEAYFRAEFNIDKPIKRAYFYTYLEGGANVYVNGKRISLKFWEKFRYYRGHVKGSGAEIAHLLKMGKNVIAIGKLKTGRSHKGFILRGEIKFTDGSIKPLVSSAKNFVASGQAFPSWEQPNFDASNWAKAWEMGDVRTKNWSIYGDVPRIYCTKEEYQNYVKLYTKGFPEKQLLKEPVNPEIKVVYNNLTPGISFNGKIYPLYTLSSTDVISEEGVKIIQKGREMELPFYIIRVNDQTCGSEIGHYDFNTIDLNIRRLLAINPDAKIFFSYRAEPLTKWLKRNPNECQGYAIKRKNPSYISWTYWYNPITNSFASRKYREEVVKSFVKALAEFSLKQVWARRVVGLQIQYGGSADGMPFGCHSMPDTSKPMTEAFRRFLTKKYTSNENLQKAWNDPNVTLENATVPDQVQRLGSNTLIRNLNDPRDVRLADFYTCYHQEFSSMIEEFGKAVKTYFPGRLAGAFHGYMLLGYTPEGSTAYIDELLKSPYIDYMNGTTVGYNLTDGINRILTAPLRKRNKFTSIEADIRTHLGGEKKWRCKTPEETRATVTKVIGNSLFYGCGYHIVDFGKNKKYFLCKEALEPIKNSISLWKKYFNQPMKYASDVAVIVDPNQIWMQGSAVLYQNNPFGHGVMSHTLQTLTFSGYSYDWMSLEDYLETNHKYKAVIFLNCFSISKEKQAKLLKKLRQKGITAIWNFAPGISTPSGYSNKAMKELTGLDLNYSLEQRLFKAKQNNGKTLKMFLKGDTWKASPRVYSVDKNAQVLARYVDDNTPALVSKKFSDQSTTVFSGIPINDSLLWAKLLSKAGCHAFTTPGFFVRRNNKLLMVYSGKGGKVAPESSVSIPYISQTGKVVVTLEKEAKKVIDVFTGKVVAQNVKQFTLESSKPHTWVLEIQ
jgi:hypothetical protein